MKRKSGSGFTLIEIIIALTVFTIGIVAILSLFMLGFDAAMRSADLTKAGIYTQWKMEDIKRLGFGNISDEVAPQSFPAGFDTRFTYGVDVVPDTPGSSDYYQTVTLTVTWTYKGQNYNEAFVTIIPNYAP